ncbi:UDP-N-acetylmuramate--L-alanine ligase [Candidatus Uhrbacteria bacterium RIFCSPHIGHO2_02_FULL_47_44]|uniref:UDP-N-acetylmuramate--L-alanine ligase n=1 Tax=Candidatus Uhrbacteria bacterium RIFCSPLOWO2_02_FULL_48_18 TaxID=1802408 RepID=A0A1F7VBS9_9BACT|nr:MAG: UDP-N-acetylmuramate--L-alanine ligase [Candidatus Uhrbacteria bacterium RIFCSPHIGHO2_01_FULL_47_10]OGL70475.1 MAG: UDP-N-acetylmuramate--L-alanine ligase [Candidatus Uhrbacteria bacterium RIFCSPHIGHO2_02_FULL_47_44]OGL76833.1 MAG: UDP-N-acetylmuramate--L-alanine ligase [Candidatus Uhrbacteria bacterium RIFCSPHIGHO2_12_FULL_47_12]OGL82302.1 MAG: UDP-N-acetylmuramate--L-alanine ligase [Candidatus Uhrbacteria bacterium RIFCSPLOWO2_01_FULL_47_17]OGL87949.1 MAG: UDP-N-acetylmuramate--L-alan
MLLEKNHFHFVGIGGIGMSALAKFLLSKEKHVTGSDVHDSEMVQDLNKKGIQVNIGHDKSHVLDGVEVVIYSSAVPSTNPERTTARERGIPEVSYAQFLGEVSKTFSTIVVTGTHGKSTTTALIGLMLEAAGYDPTVLVGSFVPTFPDKNLRLGKGRFFVVEGCEYQANMLNLHPEMIVLTNIEEDHLDYYRDINHIRDTFQIFADKLIGKGMMILNADDAESMKLKVERPITYWMQRTEKAERAERNSYVALNRATTKGVQTFGVNRDELLGRLKLIIPGEHNVMNALAATAAAMELGVPFETCARVLETFPGIWRRFERVGTWREADVISDYGHHPTAVEKTVSAAREFFPGRRIVLCFQPHQHSRTKSLFDGFVHALQLADETVVAEIYDVAGRNEEHNMSSRLIVEKIKKETPNAHVMYSENFDAVKSALEQIVRSNDVLIIMGAGDIDSIARDLTC